MSYHRLIGLARAGLDGHRQSLKDVSQYIHYEIDSNEGEGNAVEFAVFNEEDKANALDFTCAHRLDVSTMFNQDKNGDFEGWRKET